MSGFVAEAVKRLNRRDPKLKEINLIRRKQTDKDLAELVDSLLCCPDFVVVVHVAFNQLTDETGVKLARFLAASTAIGSLDLRNNQFGEATYLAVAAALRVNTSLRNLFISDNQAVDQTRIDAAFVEALRINPNRPTYSAWRLYLHALYELDARRLKEQAEQLGHPSLQMLLLVRVR